MMAAFAAEPQGDQRRAVPRHRPPRVRDARPICRGASSAGGERALVVSRLRELGTGPRPAKRCAQDQYIEANMEDRKPETTRRFGSRASSSPAASAAETRLRTLELADGSWVDLPVIVLRGAQPGPVFYLGAAFHGDEVNGVEIATRFAGEIELARCAAQLSSCRRRTRWPCRASTATSSATFSNRRSTRARPILGSRSPATLTATSPRRSPPSSTAC